MTDIVASPRLLISFDLSNAGKWDSETKEVTTTHDYKWNQAQWRYIECAAFRMLLATMENSAPWYKWEDAIPPEALDYWDDEVPEGLFTDDESLNGVATAIGVVDAILGQFEEEIGKRGGSLP
jgi:hypothetical protein